jgi:hypothetical protein
MNLKQINDWWRKGLEKEKRRLTNAPKPHKGDKFSVPEDFSNFAPPLKKAKGLNAR